MSEKFELFSCKHWLVMIAKHMPQSSHFSTDLLYSYIPLEYVCDLSFPYMLCTATVLFWKSVHGSSQHAVYTGSYIEI